MRVLLRGLVVISALVLAASFAGRLHGLGDSLAVFRGAILAMCTVSAVLVWRWRGAQVLGVVGVAVWVAQFSDGAFARTPDDPDLILYQKNLLYFERDRSAFIADVLASRADVVTLQEISPSNVPVLEALSTDYPYQLLCNAAGQRTSAVLSRTAVSQVECLQGLGAARLVTTLRGRVIQVYSVHLYWPWPYHQARQVDQLVGLMDTDEPMLTAIGGDFNMVPWAHSVAQIEQASGTTRIGRAVATYDLYGYPLAIDHVLASGGVGAIEARDKLGSDHRGVLARIVWP